MEAKIVLSGMGGHHGRSHLIRDGATARQEPPIEADTLSSPSPHGPLAPVALSQRIGS
jgi:hypothetical protein